MSTAAILAGGLGTRLASVVSGRQKVVAPVGGRPFVFNLLDDLWNQGIERVVMCVGHKAATVREVVGDRYSGMEILWSEEEEPLGTGGALACARTCFPLDEPVYVLNGDSWCDVDLEALAAFHRNRGAEVTLTLTRVTDASRFGSVELLDDRRVLRFTEKDRPGSAWINAGVYVFGPAALARLPGGRFSLETDLFPSLPLLYGYKGGGRFIDIGVPSSYSRAEDTWKDPGGASSKRLVMVDRDGTLNREVHHLRDPDQLALLPGAARALRRLKALGFKIALITNQSAIGRGLLDTATLDAVHSRLLEMLGEQGAGWDWTGYCPHLPEDGCSCRKPKPGLAREAAAVLGRPLGGSFLIGDKATDLGMGRAVGATNLLVLTGYGETEPTDLADHVVEDIWCAAVTVESLTQGEGCEN